MCRKIIPWGLSLVLSWTSKKVHKHQYRCRQKKANKHSSEQSNWPANKKEAFRPLFNLHYFLHRRTTRCNTKLMMKLTAAPVAATKTVFSISDPLICMSQESSVPPAVPARTVTVLFSLVSMITI
jgi:hypothetical protein